MSIPDVEDFVACWLQTEMRSATERDSDDDLPFALVTRVAGADTDSGTDDPVVQVEFFDRGPVAASATKTRGHDRMMLLRSTLADVVMSDGTIANPDFVTTRMYPVRMPYADANVVRYVGRYEIGLS